MPQEESLRDEGDGFLANCGSGCLLANRLRKRKAAYIPDRSVRVPRLPQGRYCAREDPTRGDGGEASSGLH